MESRHWAIKAIFEMAEEAGLKKPNWEPFEARIKEVTGKHIPRRTLKAWENGYSLPQLDVVEWMALALGYEIDLIKIEETPKYEFKSSRFKREVRES